MPEQRTSIKFPCLNILPRLSNSDLPKASLSSKNTVCAPAERARPGQAPRCLSVLLLSAENSCPVLEFGTIYGGLEPSRNRVVVPARQAMQPFGIGSLESILGILKSLKIRALETCTAWKRELTSD